MRPSFLYVFVAFFCLFFQTKVSYSKDLENILVDKRTFNFAFVMCCKLWKRIFYSVIVTLPSVRSAVFLVPLLDYSRKKAFISHFWLDMTTGFGAWKSCSTMSTSVCATFFKKSAFLIANWHATQWNWDDNFDSWKWKLRSSRKW